jgi:hypothetical protein
MAGSRVRVPAQVQNLQVKSNLAYRFAGSSAILPVRGEAQPGPLAAGDRYLSSFEQRMRPNRGRLALFEGGSSRAERCALRTLSMRSRCYLGKGCTSVPAGAAYSGRLRAAPRRRWVVTSFGAVSQGLACCGDASLAIGQLHIPFGKGLTITTRSPNLGK